MTDTIDKATELDDLLNAEPDAEHRGDSPLVPGLEDILAVPADSLAAQQIDHSLGTHRGHPVLPFDFQRPYNISKAFEKNMLTICESFSKAASLTFTSMLRANVIIDQDCLQLTTFGDYLRSLPDLSCVGTVSLAPLTGHSLVLLDIGMSFIMMKRLLGGNIEAETTFRKFSDIEFGVSSIVMGKLLEAFKQGMDKTLNIETELHGLENNPTYLGTMSSSETVILLKFKIDMEELAGEIVFCIPITAFEPVWDMFSPDESAEQRTSQEIRRDRRRVFEMLQITAADVVVNLDEMNMTMAQVLQIRVGDTIPLRKSMKSKLTVEIQGRPMFLGTPGKVNNSRAVRVTDRLDWED